MNDYRRTIERLTGSSDTLPDVIEPLRLGAPMGVEISIPLELIDIAKCYPEIDWNDVMRHAVRNFDTHRAAQPKVRTADLLAESDS